MSKSRRLAWTDHLATMEKDRNTFIILTDKLTGKSPTESPRHRWNDNIRMDLKEIGVNTRNWTGVSQDRD